MGQVKKGIFAHSGILLVIVMVGLGLLGASATVWNYSRHVFTTQHATVVNDHGEVEAFFPMAAIGKIQPHQAARITNPQSPIFGKKGALTKPVKAYVVSVKTLLPTVEHSQSRLSVTLRAIENSMDCSPEVVLVPGTRCYVTIDTTVPTSS